MAIDGRYSLVDAQSCRGRLLDSLLAVSRINRLPLSIRIDQSYGLRCCPFVPRGSIPTPMQLRSRTILQRKGFHEGVRLRYDLG